MTEPTSPGETTPQLTHLDSQGRANMVDVSGKPATHRTARARAIFRLDPTVRARLLAGELAKGEALAVARIAGIQAAKATGRLIPLCHPVALSWAAVEFAPVGEDGIEIRTEAVTAGPTGVEMEALTAASIAALTLYDMVKAACRGARVEDLRLLHKSGGRSGEWNAGAAGPEPPPGG